jgi:hypothetical protein
MQSALESAHGPLPGDATHGFPHYQMPKHQHRTPALDYSSMTMASMESSRDGSRSVRGILSRYTPIQGVQYFRDLAGNIRQVCMRACELVFRV